MYTGYRAFFIENFFGQLSEDYHVFSSIYYFRFCQQFAFMKLRRRVRTGFALKVLEFIKFPYLNLNRIINIYVFLITSTVRTATTNVILACNTKLLPN